MRNESMLAPHETMELHELLNSSVTGYKTLRSSINMVKDPELKSYMQNCLHAKRSKIQEMEKFITDRGMVQ